MTIVDRYVARTFLSGFLILLTVGIGLYILSDAMINIDEFTEDRSLGFGDVLLIMADFYGHNIPLYVSQLAGPVMAIAASFTVGNMLRNNELVALAAAGMPLQRLAAPLLVTALVLIGLWVVNREVVIPSQAAKIARTYSDVTGTQEAGVPCARDGRRAILTALKLSVRQGRLEKVFIIAPDERGRPTWLIEADSALWDAAAKTWRLTRGRRLLMVEDQAAGTLGDPIRYEPVAAYAFGLSPEELLLRQRAQWSDLLSLAQMTALLKSQNLANSPTINMSRHIRITQPMLMWIMLALTIPFFLTRAPESVFSAGGKAMLLSGLCFATAFMVQGTVEEGVFAALAAWLPILIFGPIAVLNLANART